MPGRHVERIRPGFFDFYNYPPVGEDDWAYMFQSAQVRTLETQMLTRTALLDMANAPDFPSAVSSLGGTEYTLPQGAGGAEVEAVLMQRREAVRDLFEDLMLHRRIVEVFKSRDDFANLRLAMRHLLTDHPIGAGYSRQGNVPPDALTQALEEENYAGLPDYVCEAIEQAVLAYYQNKDIRQIDHAIDRVQANYTLRMADETDSLFLENLFRIQIDLTNIRTMLRLKFVEADRRDVLLEGGFIELDRFRQGLDLGYEALGSLFFGTPYHYVVDAGAAYLSASSSFLKVEQQCDEYMLGYLRQTGRITAGPQPVVAFLLAKEREIRTVRLILTAKRNDLETKLILDRVA